MDKNQISTSYEKYDRVFARAFSKKQKGKFIKFALVIIVIIVIV